MSVTATIATTQVTATVTDAGINAHLATTVVQAEIGNSVTIIGGSTGDIATATYDAGEVISALKALYLGTDGKVYHADSATTSTRNIVGIATQSVLMGASIVVRHQHTLSDALWSWTVGSPVYVGAGGSLTQTPPATGYIAHVGIAITPTSIFVDIQPPILLS